MSDELLKWLFGVNEVLKMSIATEHSDVPAHAFQQYVLKCMFYFFFCNSSEPFFKNAGKRASVLFPSFINLYSPLFLSTRFTSFCYRSFFFFPFLATSFLSFSSFPPVLFQQDPQNFLLLKHIQWSVTVILLFQVFPVSKSHCRWGGEWTGIWTNAFRQQGLSCMLHPNSTSGEGWEGSDRERGGGGGLWNTHHTWKSPHSNREKSRALTER